MTTDRTNICVDLCPSVVNVDPWLPPNASIEYGLTADVGFDSRMHRSDKTGYTPRNLPSLLERLGIEVEHWRLLTKKFGRIFSQVAGKAHPRMLN